MSETQSIKKSADLSQNSDNISQLYYKISDIIPTPMPQDDLGYKLMLLEYTDKLLQINGSHIKVNMRGSDKRFSNIFINQQRNDDQIMLHLYKSELLTILSSLNWKVLYQANEQELVWHAIDFLNEFANAIAVQDGSEIGLSIKFNYIRARIASDWLLNSFSNMLEVITKDFQNVKQSIILNSIESQNQDKNNFDDSELEESNTPSLIKILKCISICLLIDEQIWINSKYFRTKLDVSKCSKVVNRIQTSYGRLASYISYPTSKIHPIHLSEVGLVSTSDKVPNLFHYLEYGSKIEDDVLSSIYVDTKSLLHYLESKFSNNMMLKGFDSINVPLYRTINYQPPWVHTSISRSNSDLHLCISESEITHVLVNKSCEFIATANQNDGSVWIWNSVLHLFKAGSLNFKYNIEDFKHIEQLEAKIEYLRNLIKAKEDNQNINDVKITEIKDFGLGYEHDSEDETEGNPNFTNETVESILKLASLPELNEEILNTPVPLTAPEIISLQASKIIPDPKLLEDLINMGFSKEESEKALIDIKNASIELAVDKVFENKNKLEEMDKYGLQAAVHDSLSNSPAEISKEQIEKEAELKRLEEEKQKEIEEQKRLDEIKEFRETKESEIENIQQEINQINQNIEFNSKSIIRGLVM